VVGGVLFSLILTLFVIPAIYTYLSRPRKHTEFDKQVAEPSHEEEVVYEV
jgi:multidrug efflux pump